MVMIECILFDLDNTLYPKSLGIFEMVVQRIWDYMEGPMGLEKDFAKQLRQEYVKRYGSTLRGLMAHYHVDPEDYLDYVHDVAVEKKLSPNPSLSDLLGSISFQKVIFTSAHRPHAQKVLSCLGVEQYFSSIFDISFADYVPKPNPEPYEKILAVLGVSGEKCLMIEDTAVNLRPAKEMGMTTVLVSPNAVPLEPHIDYQIADILDLRKILRTMNNAQCTMNNGPREKDDEQ